MSYSLSFSKSIFVVVFISDKIQQGLFEFLSTQLISDSLNIPKPTLVKILQNLTRTGIVETKEGKNGGIRLAKKPSDITVLDVFSAMEQGKPLFQTSFDIQSSGKRPENAKKSITVILHEAESRMKDTLSHKTIADILNDISS